MVVGLWRAGVLKQAVLREMCEGLAARAEEAAQYANRNSILQHPNVLADHPEGHTQDIAVCSADPRR